MNVNPRGRARPPGAPESLQTAECPAVRPDLPFSAPLLALTLCAATCLAANVTSTIDGGGGRSASARYVNDGSLGGLGGVTGMAASETNKAGYLGQLSEVSSVVVAATPAQVNEGATSQLSGAATLDDATVTLLAGSDLVWSAPAWPIQGILPGGVATAALVYTNAPGTFSGQYLGVPGAGSLLVLDSIPDNYGSYAGDGLPDDWQVRYFGLNNPDAAPDRDVTGTGQNNLFKYVAGLDPTNAASRFVLRLAGVPGRPGQKQLIFSPRWNDRTYTPEFRSNLMSGRGFTALTNIATSDSGTERTVTDTNATENAKFYHVRISYP